MKTVYKYPVAGQDYFKILMPKDANILSVQTQSDDTVSLWAYVDTDAPLEHRYFRIAGTGHEITDEHILFIGTFQVSEYLVFHLFEILN
ncbi:MAG: hypothetical protein WA061_02710 [Microgenomates group bacterium]